MNRIQQAQTDRVVAMITITRAQYQRNVDLYRAVRQGVRQPQYAGSNK